MRFSNGWNDALALSSAAYLGKLHQKCIKYSKQLLVTMTREEQRLLSDILDSNVGKIRLKIVSVQVFLTGVTDENIEKVHKIVNED
jgi:hypothetical protein